MPFILIVLATLTWSLDTLIRYPLLQTIKPEILVLIEHYILVLIFAPFVFGQFSNFIKLVRSNFFSFIVIGTFGSAISTLAFTKAFSLINPSLVILLQKLQPIVVISLSYVVLKERISKNFYLNAVLAIFGGILISYPDISELSHVSLEAVFALDQSKVFGYLFTALAVVGWGASTVYGKKISLSQASEIQILSGRFTFGLLFLIPYCLIASDSSYFAKLTDVVFFKILVMVLISGLLGMFLYYKGLKKLSSHLSAVAELFFPIFAVTINWLFLDKALQPIQILGAVILVGASYFIKK